MTNTTYQYVIPTDYLARRERDKQEAREMAELEKPREPEVQEDEDNG
jgi:hypothetical protein